MKEKLWKVFANILYTGSKNPKMWAILVSATAGTIGYAAHSIRIEDIANGLSIISTLLIPALPDRFIKEEE